jgi:hypothetical protein
VYIVFVLVFWNELAITIRPWVDELSSALKIDLNIHAMTSLVVLLLAMVAIFLDPILDVLLRLSVVALVYAISLGYCSSPTLPRGIGSCIMVAAKLSFSAIAATIHRLLDHSGPGPGLNAGLKAVYAGMSVSIISNLVWIAVLLEVVNRAWSCWRRRLGLLSTADPPQDNL